MPFSQAVIDRAFERAEGQCECARNHTGVPSAPHASGRCPATFTKDDGQWQAHHKIPEGGGFGSNLFNCEVLCLQCLELA